MNDFSILEERMDGIPRKLAKSGVRVGSLDCADQVNQCLPLFFLLYNDKYIVPL